MPLVTCPLQALATSITYLRFPAHPEHHEKKQDCEAYAHSGSGKGSVHGPLSL